MNIEYKQLRSATNILPLFITVYFVQRSTKTPFALHDFRRHCRLSLSFYCVHQRNLRISATFSILRKYEQKALCTKIPLSRGVTGKTFTDTKKKKEKKEKKSNKQIPPTFRLGLPYWQHSNEKNPFPFDVFDRNYRDCLALQPDVTFSIQMIDK